MKYYKVKSRVLSGSTYKQLEKQAQVSYKTIIKRTKRRPYIRSTYFKKDKIFLELFWRHLHQKNWRDRKRRIKYFDCAIELLRHTNISPTTKEVDSNILLHRFGGITNDGGRFFVQVKEDKRSDQKWFMSVFPYE